MICRSSQQGQRLDVAGLNQILVLVDRSETRLTEVGLNTWRKGLEGPPHSHEAKEQIFYVTAGSGVVVVGNARYAVRPGSLVYVPPRVIHQTIVTGEDPLTYLLFNAFLDASKEGHASFAEHIEQVKLLRKQQAETQKADVAGSSASLFSDRPGKHVPEADGGPRSGSGALLLDRSETCRSEVARLVCLAGGHVEAVTDPVAERTLYVLKGGGQLALGDETAELHPGDVAFIPWHTPHRLIATQSDLVCLCFSTRVADAVAV